MRVTGPDSQVLSEEPEGTSRSSGVHWLTAELMIVF